MPGKRMLSFDIIRIVAILMVVMVHTSLNLVAYYDPQTQNAAFQVGNLFGGLARAGTPMFMMLSGALFLDEGRDFDPRRFFRKSLLGLLRLLVFWTLFFAICSAVAKPLIEGRPVDMALFWDCLLSSNADYPHLWYMFMLAGAYLAIPVLRLYVKAKNRRYILGLIIISTIAQFFAQTAEVFTLKLKYGIINFMDLFYLDYFIGYVPYLMIGWYLSAFPPKGKARIALIGAGAAAAVIIVVGVPRWIHDIPNIREYIAEIGTLPAMVYGVGVFTLISSLAGERETRSRVLITMSRTAFGVYILHMFFLKNILSVMPYAAFHEQHPFLYLITLFVSVYTVTLGAVLLLSRIRGVRALVRG